MLLNYCEGQRSFVVLPPRTSHVVAIIPLAKNKNISCFEGHLSTSSDHKMQDNFTVFIFKEEMCHIVQKTW